MSATPGTPRSAARRRPIAPAAGQRVSSRSASKRPICGLGRCWRVEQEPAVLMVEQHPLAIVADRDRGQRGRHAQDMLDRAEVDPVPFQLVRVKLPLASSPTRLISAASTPASPPPPPRCRPCRPARRRGRRRYACRVTRGTSRIAEDEIDDGDADAQDPCHCLPELVAATVAGLWGAVQVGCRQSISAACGSPASARCDRDRDSAPRLRCRRRIQDKLQITIGSGEKHMKRLSIALAGAAGHWSRSLVPRKRPLPIWP